MRLNRDGIAVVELDDRIHLHQIINVERYAVRRGFEGNRFYVVGGRRWLIDVDMQTVIMDGRFGDEFHYFSVGARHNPVGGRFKTDGPAYDYRSPRYRKRSAPVGHGRNRRIVFHLPPDYS